MPAKFTYRAPGKTYTCTLNCSRCIAVSASTKKRCTRTTCMASPYCWQHARSNLKVRVMKSMFLDSIGINALGLYAWDPSKKDRKEPIYTKKSSSISVTGKARSKPIYGGELITKEQLSERYDSKTQSMTAPYGHKSRANGYMDAACHRGIGAYANSLKPRSRRTFRWIEGKRSTTKKYAQNAKLLESLNIKATKNIYHGDEILISYGPEYWKGEKDTEHRTYPLKVSGDKRLRIPNYVAKKLV